LDYDPTTPVTEGMLRFWDWYRAEALGDVDAETPD
jgi:hypothetical protein